MRTGWQGKHFKILVLLDECIGKTEGVRRIYGVVHKSSDEQQTVLVVLNQILVWAGTHTV